MSSFDEREDRPVRSPARRQPPSGPPGPPVDRQTLMVRRTIAGGAVVVALILLVLGFRGCLDARKERSFKDYARDVKELVDASQQQSDALFGLLREGGQSAIELEQTINGFGVEAEQLADRAEGLDAPDEMKTAQRYLVDTLELRRDGTRSIARLLRTALGEEGRSEATQRIAAQMLNFLASDVLYTQRVVPNLRDPLEKEEVLAEVQVASSQFLPDIDWLRPGTVADRISRIRGGGGGGEDGEVAPGLHGNGVNGVTVQPSGQTLAAGGALEIRLSESLRFDVSVQNQGENEETDVTVKVSLAGSGKPIVFEERLDSIAAGETKVVQIPVAEPPPTGQPVQVTVEVEPVPGEEKTDNNKLEARAIFTR